MWIKIITAVLQIDVRNPFDKLVIGTFGVSSSSEIPKSTNSLEKTEIWSEFKKVKETGILNLSLSSNKTEEVHKLHGMNGKKVHEVELLAKEIWLDRGSIIPRIPSGDLLIDPSFRITKFIMNRNKEPKLFATLQFTDATLLQIVPVTDQASDLLLYQVKFDGRGHSRTGTYHPD